MKYKLLMALERISNYPKIGAEEPCAESMRIIARKALVANATETPTHRIAELPNAAHSLPIGAVVDYTSEGKLDHARLVVVQHSRDCDGEPLYMVGKEPIEPPPVEYGLYSRGYLAYRLHVGWFAGNVPLSMLKDTGKRVAVARFEVERYLG